MFLPCSGEVEAWVERKGEQEFETRNSALMGA